MGQRRGALTRGSVLDLIGFVLFLKLVLVSNVILLTRENARPHTAGAIDHSQAEKWFRIG